MDLLENNFNSIRILLNIVSKSSFFLGILPDPSLCEKPWDWSECVNHSLYLLHLCIFALFLLSKALGAALRRLKSSKQGWRRAGHCALGRFAEVTLLQLCLVQGRRRHSLNGLTRSSTVVTLALREHRHHHGSSTKKSHTESGGCPALSRRLQHCLDRN